MSTLVEQLKAIPILDVANRLGLHFHGTRMHCFNRTHEDRKTPSLHFNVPGNYFNCFGCELGGSTIDLVMACSGCTRKDAMQWLAQEFGLSRQTSRVRRIRPRVRKQGLSSQRTRTRLERTPDPEIYDWLLEKAQLPRQASEYLLKRGLSAQTISHFRLGGSLEPRSLVRVAEKRFGSDRVFKAGLLTEGKASGKRWPVWLAPVVLIPFYLKGEAPVYLQARRLHTVDKGKYVGLSGVAKPLFNAQVIHGLATGAKIHVVEGAMDAMAAHEIGLAAIGVLGSMTKFKRSWALALRHLQVTIVPDQDASGLLFKDRVVSAFASIGKSVQVLYLPAEYDDLTDALEGIKEGRL